MHINDFLSSIIDTPVLSVSKWTGKKKLLSDLIKSSTITVILIIHDTNINRLNINKI